MFQGSGDIYDRFVGRYSPALARAMCETAGIVEGQRALDVGCGSGALVGELAARLGPENVAGVDPSEPFVETARAKVPRARIEVGPAESLPFADGEFDATLSQLVVNFLSEPERALAEMARVTRAGGLVAGSVWEYGGGMTMLRTFWEAAVALHPEHATLQMESHTMRFARPEELAALWRTGLEEVDVSPIDVDAAYDDFEDLWSPFPTGVGPAGAYAASLDDEARDRLREEFARRLGAPPGSPFTLSARAWCAVGRVGGAGPIEAG